MSNNDGTDEDGIKDPSLHEYSSFEEFSKNIERILTNFNFNSDIYTEERSRFDEKKKKYDFYKKFRDFNSSNFIKPFFLEEELAKQIKYWHSTNEEFNLPLLSLDNFFNSENVKQHLLKDKYIEKNPSVITYYLIDKIITLLEKKTFDKILIDGITTYQEQIYHKGLIGPIIDRDLIYYLIKNDIEEKLNILYKENSLGYSYITEKIITFDLFIIYLVLKNYPFYILRRERLEEIFSEVKKFKNFPYPIGSIGMDLFKLLIQELYLPGVSLFQEIRETFLLDIIDPIILEIDCDYFIKVIAFSKKNTLYELSKEKKIDMNNKKEYYNKKNKKNDKYELNKIKEFTFSAYGVYSAYILYSADDEKEEKENSYLGDILALFEKRYKIKKEEEEEKQEEKKRKKKEKQNNNININNNNIENNDENENDKKDEQNIHEKNVINSIINLINIGLDSNFAVFSRGVKAINEKLITKTKEMSEIKNNSPKDNINLRKFLYHNITYFNFELSEKVKKRNNKKVIFEDEKSIKLTGKKLKSSINKEINTKYNINNIIDEDAELELEEENQKLKSLKEKKDCISEIKKYKKILDEEKYIFQNDKNESDEILDNYVDNFLKLKDKYFWHMQKFDMNANFPDDETKKELQDFNKITENREKILPKLYKQKYLIKEDQLLDFIKLLYKYKTNIIPLYHYKLYSEYINTEQPKIKKQNENKNSLYKYFDIFENEYPETDKDYSSTPLLSLTELKEGLEKIVKSKLYFNHKIYLIPGPLNTSLTKHLSRNDYIYKSTIGDVFLNLYKEKLQSDKIEEMLEMPVQIYLREAKHYFDLTIFKTIIDSSNNYKEYKNIFWHKNFFLLYGGVHIEGGENLDIILDEKKSIKFENRKSKIYIDIIHLYNYESNDNTKKINDIEKYLVYPSNNKFQIFISGAKDEPNIKSTENINNQNQYFQNYVGNLINFDVKSAYYEAKKIVVNGENFTLIPTFFEDIKMENCSYFEIAFDNSNNEEEEINSEEKEDDDDNDNDENKNDINDKEKISKFFESEKTTSLNIKISSFIDLEYNDD